MSLKFLFFSILIFIKRTNFKYILLTPHPFTLSHSLIALITFNLIPFLLLISSDEITNSLYSGTLNFIDIKNNQVRFVGRSSSGKEFGMHAHKEYGYKEVGTN